MSRDGRVPEPLWSEIQASVPIAGVDLLPLRMDPDEGLQVGLILRDFPEGGQRWCHVGGRQDRNETQAASARRHLGETLTDADGRDLPVDEIVPHLPHASLEFLTEARDGYGYDPRKHAVSACFRVWLPGGTVHRPGGEADDFQWFSRNHLPAEDALWPGTLLLVDRLLTPSDDDLAVYASVTARQAGHNGLLWQTPALAMTAQSFLMTIALGTVPVASRIVAGVLGVVIALISIQLMDRHSESERNDSRILHRIEVQRGMRPAHGRFRGETWRTRVPSRIVWMVGLALFGVASLLVVVAELAQWDWFAVSP